ncbi:MAG: NAD(P)/FAD-dependent oxidoreductase [Polyangiales bacterium]
MSSEQETKMENGGDRYDVVVVGGRVAGASVAMLLARAGYRVAIVDRARLPSDTLSTHNLWQAGSIQLRRWGLLAQVIATGAPASTEVHNTVDGACVTIPLPPVSGVHALYGPRRNILDPIVLQAAEEAGASFYERVVVTGVSRDSTGRVDGIMGRDPMGKPIRLRARYVVGADGWRSRIAREVGAREYNTRPITNALHYAYWEGLDHRGTEFWFRASGVMAGVIPTNGGACVYVNCRSDRADALWANLQEGYLCFLGEAAPDLRKRLRLARQTCRVRATRGLPGFFRKPYGPGWVLVGDAGHTTDPVSANGITNAFRDAELAARAIDQALRDAPEQDAFAQYHTQRDSMSQDVYEIASEMAAYSWDSDRMMHLLFRFGRALSREANQIAAFPEWSGVTAPPHRAPTPHPARQADAARAQ